MQRCIVFTNRCALRLIILCQRNFSSATPIRKNEEKIKIKIEPPTDIKRNWIGPPDETSNIRPVKFVELKDETTSEKRYREKHQELLQWNQEHWANHNRKFFQSKEEFVKCRLKEKKEKDGLKAETTLSPEEISVFYKRFLDDHYSMHLKYNKEWYRRNLALLWPAFLAFIDKRKRKKAN